MVTTFQTFLAWTFIHARGTEGDEENPPDNATQENPSAAEAQEQAADSEDNEADSSNLTTTSTENQQDDEETGEMASQPSTPVDTDEESSPGAIQEDVVGEADRSITEGTEEVTVSSDDVIVDVSTDEPIGEIGAVDEAGDEGDEGEVATESQEETIEEPKTPLSFGVIDEVYNFVNEFQHSQSSDAEQTSASTQDSAGGVEKAAIFEHPPAEGYARSPI